MLSLSHVRWGAKSGRVVRDAVAAIVLLTIMVHTGKLAAATIKSVRAMHDVTLTLDPHSAFWRDASPIEFESDNYGRPISALRTEVRSRWTSDSLYLLFVCPYQRQNLKPSPETKIETNNLWNWDVAEMFIGFDFEHIRRYKEFEVSPQGEWVDLAIDLDKPNHSDGWTWNSKFETAAHIDVEKKIWYGAMRIPFASIYPYPAQAGIAFRVNFFRCEGAPVQLLAWQPAMGASFHVPERFGRLELVESQIK